MTPGTFAEWVALWSLLIAAAALIITVVKNDRESSRASQALRDKLENIRMTVEETRETLRSMDSKLDDHGTRLTRAEERIDTLFNNYSRLQNNMDRCEYCRKAKEDKKLPF
jgi:uncharacterized protein HemX